MQPDSLQLSRRTFLKTAGATALGSALPATSQEAATPQDSDSDKREDDPLQWVNLLQGTNSTIDFSRGNTLPIAALPFGMTHWTLQSNAGGNWFFDPHARRVQGIRCTHQIGPWLGDYGYAVFLPFRGETRPEPGARASSYAVEQAKLAPNSLSLFLLRPRAQVELIPVERGALLTAEFEQDELPGVRGLLVDAPSKAGAFRADAFQHRLYFESRANSGGVPENFSTYYVVQFADPWDSFELKETQSGRVGLFRFGQRPRIEARIATSFISFEQAELNLTRELGRSTAEELRTAGAKIWNTHLRRIEIDGGTQDQRRTFYSCMYRTLLFPRVWHELDGTGAPHHFSAFNGKVEPGLMYADHGYWDVYRAWYPLMTVLFPERLGDILQSWVNAYKEGGWFPQFPSPGYRACMTGSLIDSVFGDAAVKSISGFDLATAYQGLKKHATTPGDPSKGYGRVGFEYYATLHYVPADKVMQSTAETVDAAYGDFCIAQVAKALGLKADEDFFLKRSANWRHLYDTRTKFFRGKNEDGSWLEPFRPVVWGSPYVEGSAWQHRWDAPQDIPGMIAAAGGAAPAADALQQMLAHPPIFEVGVYGAEIHEMAEMAAVPFGQYAQSNQPSHHLLYLLAHAGRPDLTQHWVRKTMDELYTPDSFPGDEDSGSMAAWYVLSALGIYAACPGKAEYTLGSPLFPRATVHLPQGRTLIVDAPGNKATTPRVRQVSFRGQTLHAVTVSHADLVQGGMLSFRMSS